MKMYNTQQQDCLFCLAFIFLIQSCSAASPTVGKTSSSACKLKQWWLYQINTPAGQPYNVTAIADSNADFVVIDYLHNGAASRLVTPADLLSIRSGGVSKKGFARKTVLAYMSAGEAEIYRYYWNPGWADSAQASSENAECNGKKTTGAPQWLLEPSSESCTLWRIQFWHSQWISVLDSYVDVLAKAGFDGVYLDNIDAYQWFADEFKGKTYRPVDMTGIDVAHKMISFIEHIAERGRKINPTFAVFTQNGDVIVQDVVSQEWQKRYLITINGTGVEDVWYRGGPNTENNAAVPEEERLSRMDALKQVFTGNDKTVLSVEYLYNKPEEIDKYYEAACQAGFVPFAARGALDETVFPPLQVPPPHGSYKLLQSLGV